MREEPEEQSQDDADDQAGDDGEIESGVLAAMDDVAGETTEAERQFGAEVKESAEDDEKTAQDEESAAEIAERFHKRSIEETPPGSHRTYRAV